MTTPPDPAAPTAATAQPTGAAPHQRDRFRDWPAPARFVIYAIAGLVLLLVLALIATTVVVRRTFPQTGGTLHVTGLDGQVTVRRDAHGVPQVYADTTHDLFFAQGFVQSQDRFWQMDFRRHQSAGRLSELFGARTLPDDLMARTLGLRRVAAEEYPLLSAQTREALDAFSDGVNAWRKRYAGPRASLEYTMLAVSLDYAPEPWTPIDSLAWLKATAWGLAGNIDDEIARAGLSVDRDQRQIAELYPAYPTRAHPPILAPTRSGRPMSPPGSTADPAAAGRAGYRMSEAMRRPLRAVAAAQHRVRGALGSGEGVGSNSWVVSGSLTTTGEPLLANDPHLDVQQPGMLYQMGLHCRTVDARCPYDVSGFTWAGFPGVLIGHNRDIAWGMTNLRADTTDLYLEKLDGRSYLYGDREEPLAERDERIRIAGGDSKLITVRSTRHGPLVSDVSASLSSVGANAPAPDGAPSRGNGYAVAVNWTGLTPGRSADAIIGIDRATDWTTFRASAAQLTAPATSLTYADRAGHIGYQATGAIPVRPDGQGGDYPVAGWVAGRDAVRPDGQVRVVPSDRLPSELDPGSGIIVAANQAPQPPDTGPALGEVWDYGYRSARIGSLLKARTRDGGKLRLADMTAIQADTRNPMAPVLVPYLLDVLLPSAYYSGGQRLLAEWDYSQPADSAAAAYFNAVWRNLLALTFHDQLRPALWPDGSSRWMAVMTALLQQPDSPWWDDVHTSDVDENRDMILTEALKDARDELVRRQARDPDSWTWGHLHQLELKDPVVGSLNRLMSTLFDRTGQGTGGGTGAVDATSWDARGDYTVTQAPAMRMVVDLADLDRSRWINLAGASGHAFDGHYRDQLAMWQRGGTTAWPWSERAVRSSTKATLTLRPDR